MAEPYEVFAVKYAENSRRASENFLGGDPHDGMAQLDYFVWVIVGREKTWLVDCGFDPAVGARRNRPVLRSPAEGLAMLGIAQGDIADVIVTHLHYDHAGNDHLFPEATWHLQDSEMAFATGRHICHGIIGHAYECDYVVAAVRRLYRGKLQFHDPVDELAPSLSVHHVGGHTAGLQVVRVLTRRGWVVLASDATHLYANMERGRPFPIVHNVADALEGYRTMRRLASSPDHIIPGHDPLVLHRYPPPRPDLAGIVARLDVDPVAA